jgi:hypothetical protein
MNDATVKRLNQINRVFYQITAASFDESRGEPWPGWVSAALSQNALSLDVAR